MKCPKNNIKNFFLTTSQKHYKKAPFKLETLMYLEPKNIVELNNLDERIECIARTPTFLTLNPLVPDVH